MTRPSRAVARRRRAGAAAFVALALLALGLLLRPGGATPTLAGPTQTASVAASPSRPAPAHGSPTPTATQSADITPVPAWLAWMPGGFPGGFTAQIAENPALTRTVVVAGD